MNFRFAKVPDEPINMIPSVVSKTDSSSSSSSESSSESDDSEEERRNKQLKILEKEVSLKKVIYVFNRERHGH